MERNGAGYVHEQRSGDSKTDSNTKKSETITIRNSEQTVVFQLNEKGETTSLLFLSVRGQIGEKIDTGQPAAHAMSKSEGGNKSQPAAFEP